MHVNVGIDGRLEFTDMSLGMRRLVERCRNDLGLFCKEFMMDTFSDEFTGQHRDLLGLLDDDKIVRLGVCAWRGFGKTSIFSALVVRNLLYRKSRFVLYVSSSHENAMNVTEAIKYELCNNDRILDIFGSYRPIYDANEIKLGFSKRSYYIHNPIDNMPVGYVIPKGAGQTVRGLNIKLGDIGRLRPDLVCVDDIETDEDVMSDEVRGRIRNWFFSALMNVVDTRKISRENRWDDKSYYRIIVLDTMKHNDCLIRNLRDNSNFMYKDYPRARNEGGVWYSNIPEWLSDEDIRNEVDEYESHNLMGMYKREMLCDESEIGVDKLNVSDIRYYDNIPSGLDCFILVDPARTVTGSSKTAITVVYIDFNEYKIYIHEQIVNRMSIEEQISKLVELCNRYNPNVFAIETVGPDDYLKMIIETNVIKGNIYPVYLRPKRLNTKEIRAVDLIRLYKVGMIYHNEKLRGMDLERTLLAFPNTREYDAIDSAGFVIDTIQRLDIHFPNINEKVVETKQDNIIEYNNYSLKPIKIRLRL